VICMVEQETSPKDAIAELEAIYKNKKNQPKNVQSQPLPIVPPAQPLPIQSPVQPVQFQPMQQEHMLPTPPPEPAPSQNVSAMPMSFDSMFAKILDRRMKKIDDEAAAKKRAMEDRLLDKFEVFINSIADDSPVAVQPAPQRIIPQQIQTTQPPQSVEDEEEPLPPDKIFRAKKPVIKLTSGGKPVKSVPRKGLYALLALGLTIALLTGVIIGANGLPFTSQNMNNAGFIYTVGVGVYADQNCAFNATQISWGTLQLGDSVTRIAYIKNTGSANQSLSVTATGWSPAPMAQFLLFSWNATDYVLSPNQVIAAAFTLSVAKNAVGGNFAFNITVTGQGT